MSEFPLYPKDDDDREQAAADAQAMADVRTLDDWAKSNPGKNMAPDFQGGWWAIAGLGYSFKDPDAARHAAAEWVRGEARKREAKMNARAVDDWTERNARRKGSEE